MTSGRMETKLSNRTDVNFNNLPLVSIIVLTYNSASFVIETLDSIKDQTYTNIELIITDDASSDDTLVKCRQWVELNAERFSFIKIMESPVNLGISANCNKGIKAANGEWIKLIAADDVLLKDAIESNIEFAYKSADPGLVIHSESFYYKNNFQEHNRFEGEIFGSQLIANEGATAEIQYQILLRGCHVNTPTVFINKSVFQKVGFFDERFRNIEDWPMWLHITASGIRFNFLNKPTIRYRIHDASVSNQKGDDRFFKELSLTEWPIYKALVINHVTRFEKFLIIALEKRRRILIRIGLDKNNFAVKAIDYISLWPLKKLQILAEKKVFKKLARKMGS